MCEPKLEARSHVALRLGVTVMCFFLLLIDASYPKITLVKRNASRSAGVVMERMNVDPQAIDKG